MDLGSIDEKLGQENQHDVKQEGEEGMRVKKEEDVDETTPLLAGSDETAVKGTPTSRVWSIPRQIGSAVIHGVKVASPQSLRQVAT